MHRYEDGRCSGMLVTMFRLCSVSGKEKRPRSTLLVPYPAPAFPVGRVLPKKIIYTESSSRHPNAKPTPNMPGLDEDTIDEILYLARANEAAELGSFLSELSAQAKQSKADLLTAAIDPSSKNSALHYAAANGHNGAFLES